MISFHLLFRVAAYKVDLIQSGPGMMMMMMVVCVVRV